MTMTPVGYGDISPQTALGKALASIAMIIGYSMLAVPTGIVTVEISQSSKRGIDKRQPEDSAYESLRVCPMSRAGHRRDR